VNSILSTGADVAELGRATGLLAPLLALLLGIRHATDPDHLAAVSSLVVGSRSGQAWRAGALGLSWGVGHALTLVALGIPIVGFGHALPAGIHGLAELLVGLVVIYLAVRLLLRWRRGHFHDHAHTHGLLLHSHPHFHEPTHVAPNATAHETTTHAVAHEHRHLEALGRSHRSAFGIGMIHGIGGSAGAGILLVTAAGQPGEAAAALTFFAGGTAVSMALVTGAFGFVLGRGPVTRNLHRLVPVLAVLTLIFGIWYAFAALQEIPAVF
jgi:cytochrome c biogenesis protein CcdA